ncbi:uncharacterized protein A4U43_C07F1950 [Asparagus officinalis]|uniref:Uncharacterized protein n=1 Tax=Asparagus officinalis TaxID=4686 RepID=A0A5P1E8V2_ASPOF|nr:uncharacterized protein A4U43_C07F1950 [Asparagus officinalis]
MPDTRGFGGLTTRDLLLRRRNYDVAMSVGSIVTRDWKRLLKPPGVEYPDYSIVATSVDRENHIYNIAIEKSKQVPGDYLRWELSVFIYESETQLHFGIFQPPTWTHCLESYNKIASFNSAYFDSNPCPLTCGWLMNLKDKVVVVRGIEKYDRLDIIKGIGIWELHKKEWREIARMSRKIFQGFPDGKT